MSFLDQKTGRPAVEFKCICADGWTGIVCDQPVGTCPPNANPCQNGKKNGQRIIMSAQNIASEYFTDALCLLYDPSSDGIWPHVGGFRCICPPGWSGPFCGQKVDKLTKRLVQKRKSTFEPLRIIRDRVQIWQLFVPYIYLNLQ
jgi:hypothetical protein